MDVKSALGILKIVGSSHALGHIKTIPLPQRLVSTCSSTFCSRSYRRFFSADAKTKDSDSSADLDSSSSSSVPNVVIFGGRGFVGSHIVSAAEGAQKAGKVGEITVISRSANAAHSKPGLKYVSGDALKPESFKDALTGAHAVISSIGAFGSNEQMKQSCGSTNISVAKAAKECGVSRFVLISARMYSAQPPFLQGYFEGKSLAEDTVNKLYGKNGVIMRPAFVYGVRQVGIPGLGWRMRLPLQFLGIPLSAISSTSIGKTLAGYKFFEYAFATPVSAKSLGVCCVSAAIGELAGNADEMQIFESEEIEQLGKNLGFNTK
mmetsp:Transcript_3303/g.5791  ORF Transcript_3303/g.5791 Transcript_3303/m.5791 type:complete len:320 (-) Transcript_3303:186-1145(-)|eukprot:CAMPEP_0182449840 /NCGR_PEP_ID=MMETSP1172-20130603/37067_1 /TAXON_ID=708627 /ORGANISM="Timspurckia oligopyrenoides, Strain CCMP3278" /LENGTH=319 /DNA_ID=CAMNT_0024647231 /DNA_START=67 /DNA_END=1026 /DNA_ORIENTATION=+